MRLNNFNDFTEQLLSSGFSMGGGSPDGIYAVVAHDWMHNPTGSPIVWHTGDPETDPWEWRVRVLNERSDIAYAKFFFRKSGFITQAFYPYFLALRRGGGGLRQLEDEYADGLISHAAKRIYDAVCAQPALPVHEIKALGGFIREDKSKFDSALMELQMKFYLTISGTNRRRNAKGEEFGWNATVFCTTEIFWQHTDVFEQAAKLSEEEAFAAVRNRVMKLNPGAEEKRIRKFAYGK